MCRPHRRQPPRSVQPLASDIASTAQAEDGSVEAVIAAVDRFEHWRRILHRLHRLYRFTTRRRGCDLLVDRMSRPAPPAAGHVRLAAAPRPRLPGCLSPRVDWA